MMRFFILFYIILKLKQPPKKKQKQKEKIQIKSKKSQNQIEENIDDIEDEDMDEEVNEQITQHISENISNKRKDTSKRKLVQVESTNQVGEPQESKNVKKKKKENILHKQSKLPAQSLPKTPQKIPKLIRHPTPMPKKIIEAENEEEESNNSEHEIKEPKIKQPKIKKSNTSKSKVRFSGSLDFQVFKKNSSPNSLKQHPKSHNRSRVKRKL